MLPPTLLKAPGECDSLRQAGVHLWDKHAVQEGQRNRGRTGACNLGDRDIRGAEGW